MDTTQLNLRRDSEGLYFGTFKDKHKAEEFIAKLGRQYLRLDESVNGLCNKYRKEGIDLNVKTVVSWFRKMGLPIKDKGRPLERELLRSTFYLTEDLRNRLGRLSYITLPDTHKSARQFFVNATLEKIAGIENEYVMVTFNPTNDAPFVGLFARTDDDKQVYCLHLTQASKETKMVMNELCRVGNENGLVVVSEHAKNMGLTVL